eukprot:TRINITY_DN616_c0_g2_i1.p1 TRINITY_DN616_c0_g2~~TRINITY_DN616_c0_g2_i1.p1  ORF type:complete len:421 (+),score=87.76 TRINITY_DN616_c0_g2_i1:49-1311(+)
MKSQTAIMMLLVCSLIAVTRRKFENDKKLSLLMMEVESGNATEPYGSPAQNTTKASTTAETDETRRMALYHRCVDAIMHNGNVTGCPRKPVKPTRLLLLIGDSTARELGRGMDSAYTTETYTVGVRVTKLLLFKRKLVTYEDGVEVTTTIVLIGLCKIDDIRAQLLKSVENVLEKYGNPDVVYMSTGGLHECTWPWRNSDPLYASVLQRKIPDTFEQDWVRRQQGFANKPILSVAVDEYVEMQSPCFMETIRKTRLMMPEAVMVWRPFINATVLRTGGLVRSQRFTPKFCRRNQFWSEYRLQVCGLVHEKHKGFAKTVRGMGIAILDNTAYYPEHCTSGDSLHLDHDCQRIIGSIVTDIQRLGQQVIPAAMKANVNAVCAPGYFNEKLKAVKPLRPSEHPPAEDIDGSIEQCRRLRGSGK